jgi:hypothetical protein
MPACHGLGLSTADALEIAREYLNGDQTPGALLSLTVEHEPEDGLTAGRVNAVPIFIVLPGGKG